MALLTSTIGSKDGFQQSAIEASPFRLSSSESYDISRVSNGIVVRHDDGSSHFHGACSLLGLCHDSAVLLKDLESPTDRVPIAAHEGQALNERHSVSLSLLIADLVRAFLVVPVKDDSTLSSLRVPDRRLVDQSLGIFFGELAMMYPGFDEQKMREHIEMTYNQESTAKCLAALVCYRYVMVQARKAQGSTHRASVENEVYELVQSSNVLLRHVADAKPQLIDVQGLTISVCVSTRPNML